MNENLNLAKAKKDDEFYTLLESIEEEVEKYGINRFKEKTIYCNCDNPSMSSFWKYFEKNFLRLKLKKLIATYYAPGKRAYKIELELSNNAPKINKTQLLEDGDFRSDECIEILKNADFIISNPPFSLVRDYLDILIMNKKEFLFVGRENFIIYKSFWEYFFNKQIKFGFTKVNKFIRPNGELQKFGNGCWYTNIESLKVEKSYLPLTKSYYENPNFFEIGDNYNVLCIQYIKDIPYDYKEVMAVPITILRKINPNQFEILGIDTDFTDGRFDSLINRNWNGVINKNNKVNKKFDKIYLNGKRKYSRVFIRIIDHDNYKKLAG